MVVVLNVLAVCTAATTAKFHFVDAQYLTIELNCLHLETYLFCTPPAVCLPFRHWLVDPVAELPIAPR